MPNFEALNKFIYKDVAFPVNKQELLAHARRSHVPEDIMIALQRLPDVEFTEPMDVLHTLIL